MQYISRYQSHRKDPGSAYWITLHERATQYWCLAPNVSERQLEIQAQRTIKSRMFDYRPMSQTHPLATAMVPFPSPRRLWEPMSAAASRRRVQCTGKRAAWLAQAFSRREGLHRPPSHYRDWPTLHFMLTCIMNAHHDCFINRNQMSPSNKSPSHTAGS